MDDYPDANLRHYRFMLEGLRDVAATLAERRIKFVVRRGAPDRVAAALAEDAALVVCDRGYLRHQKAWRAEVARRAPCAVVEVEGDVVVPLEIASGKAEAAARTLRPKLQRVWDQYLRPLENTAVHKSALDRRFDGAVDPSDLVGVLGSLRLDRSVAPVARFRSEARRRLRQFLTGKLAGYADARSEPAVIPVLATQPLPTFRPDFAGRDRARRARRQGSRRCHRRAYLEELIVRRELAANFVGFESRYDDYACLPGWARGTLDAHRADRRPHIYTRQQLESARTHDRYWNAAMREMRDTGFMHNYMRMYWAKKILEWSADPAAAFRTVLHLNNKYFLDGRDANSYANVAWVFGLHDRPWPERPVFGKVRYMNAKGLERKFDMAAYLRAVDDLIDAERG
jgi:deoxyribodipyrimidine photo-lyase